MSIKNKISLFVSLLFAGLLVVVAVVFVIMAETQIRQTAISHQKALVKALAQNLDERVMDRHNALIKVAQSISHEAANDPSQLQPLLNALVPTLFNNILIYSPTGHVLASSPYTPEHHHTKPAPQEYIAETLNTKRPHISKLFTSLITGEPLIVMTAPLMDSSGKVVAIIAGSQYLRKDNIFSGFNNIRIGETGYLLLITQDRTLIAYPDRARIMEKVPANKNPGLEIALRNASFAGETVTSKGVPILIAYEAMKATGWLAGAAMPLEEAYAPVVAMYKHAAITVATLLFIVPSLIWLFMHILTKPLWKLRDEILFMTANPGTQALVKVSRKDEIGKLAEAFNELTLAREQSERRELSHSQILELVAKGASLNEILEALVHSLEREDKSMLCSIVLLDHQGERMLTAVSPSLPASYNSSIDGVKIGIGVGSCGTAAFTGQRVICEDIMSHPFWAPYLDIAVQAGLGACWSEPIKNTSGKVLGTFAIYHKEPSYPTTSNLRLLEQAAYLAGIAIEQSKANEELQLASLMYKNSSEAMTVADEEGNILTINPAFTEVTGYSLDDVLGKKQEIFFYSQQSQLAFEELERSLKHTGRWQGELWSRRKNGELYVLWLTVNTSVNRDGSAYRRVALFSDITQRKKSEELIWKQANFDALTNLPNRRMFQERLAQEIKKTQRTHQPLAILYLDLDRFKEVNDSLGHEMGDQLLLETARRLNRSLRQTDLVARLGGDEFIILMAELEDLNSVDRVSQEILEQLSLPYHLGIETIHVTASMGVTLYPNDASNIDELMRNADQAMYAAKNQGKNRFCFFTQAMQDAVQARIRIAKDLRQAITANELVVYYQPIIELSTGSVYKAEALIRWQHPVHGLISPADFIPVAEETGLIQTIGDWVFSQAVIQVAVWRKNHHPEFQISVNKSPIQFHTLKDSHQKWLSQLHAVNLPGSSISIEITEGLLLDASRGVTDKLLEFRDAGIQVSLDDFGTGYSSLSYLQKFDIDFIKIDKSFVSNMKIGSHDMALCEAIIVMAHKLGLKVIVEGVESWEQCKLLKAAGCDYGQGYLFSKPLPATECVTQLPSDVLLQLRSS